MKKVLRSQDNVVENALKNSVPTKTLKERKLPRRLERQLRKLNARSAPVKWIQMELQKQNANQLVNSHGIQTVTCVKHANVSLAQKENLKRNAKRWNPNGDLCETCKCIIGTEGESKKECEKTECSKCNDGEKSVPIPGQCCGKCVPAVCTQKDKNGKDVTSEIGETWNPSECEVCNCEEAADGSAKTDCKPTGKNPWKCQNRL